MTRREKSSRRAPSERVVLCDRLPTGRIAGIQCVIDRDLIIRPDDLGRYCLKALDPLIYDLVYIAGAVAFADRAVPRRIAICWRRELEVVVPVSDPDFWKQPMIIRTLIETLELLTGDTWSFQFAASKKKPKVDPQAKFPFGWGSSVVMPYSNGLDSFATERLTRRDSPKIGVINVTTGPQSCARKGQPQYRVSIPFSPRGNHVRLREISYRSRGFVFGVMAGIAANLLGADSIIIPESGQGALGPWLNPVGNEAPDVRMHPFFTASLSKFLMAVFKRPIKAEHPRLWNTKGETLKELRSEGLEQEWWRTKSCPRGRKVCLNHVRVQCGVCASCLLRRQSLLAAGLDEGGDNYLWPNLSAATLRLAAAPGARDANDNDERQAKCGLYDLNELGNLMGTVSGESRIARASGELAAHYGASNADIEGKLRRLLIAHRDEWLAFVGAQKSASFLNTWLEMLKC